MKKTTLNNIITCGMVLVLFIICGILSSAGVLGSKLSGLLVPIGIYIILSISLNLTVGILGELSLGHAGFMCIGAYVGGVFSILVQNVVTVSWLRITLAIIVGGILLGVIENLSKAYISSQLSDAIVFLVLIIVLIVKPTGIMGKKINEKV